MAQLVEHNLAKVGVAGSSPVVRSIACIGPVFESALFISTAKWPSGKAEACKAFTPGSNPGFASRPPKGPSERRAPFRSRHPGPRGAGARTPDGGDSVGVPLWSLRLRNPSAPAAGVPLRRTRARCAPPPGSGRFSKWSKRSHLARAQDGPNGTFCSIWDSNLC